MSTLKVDLDLVQKYNVAGPRYTSYPPATKFTGALTWPDFAERILENNRTERDLFFKIVDVGLALRMVQGDDGGAAAEPAKCLTKWNVEIQ